jgi:UDP-N-acetylmuramoyl-L-alanyl-D-glutamate--2,6-diaminopimelate ligase
MLLSAVLRGFPGARVSGPDVDIRAISYDSRDVEPGALFIAVPTVGGPPESGGFAAVPQAIQRGAIAVLAQPPLTLDGVTSVQVADARLAMADVASSFYDYPSNSLHLFAVTGTDGKTTTVFLLEQILRRAGFQTGMLGTVETRIGGERIQNAGRITTPEAPDVQRLLRRMLDAGVTHVALEASSHALALDRLRGCRFAACALTNLSGDHLEFHGSFEAYRDAKLKLFSELAPGKPAVLNHDDAHFSDFIEQLTGELFSYGFNPGARFRIEVSECSPSGSSFDMLEAGHRIGPFFVRQPGRFNLLNAAAACLLARQAGLAFNEIAAGLREADGPPGRFQDVSNGASFRVVVDYAHTPNAFRSVLAELREETSGNLIAVFGAAGNRDRAKRPVLAQIAAELADFFVVTNEDPFDEDADAIISEVAEGAPSGSEGSHFVRERDRGRAIRMALERAGPGDTVVITGKGHEQSIVSRGRAEPWSDAATARAILDELR